MARTRKQLDLRAVAVVLTDPGLARADMDVVAAALGVAKATLYRMAGSRDELIRLSIDSEGERLLEAVHHHGLPGFFRFLSESPAGFLLLFGGRYPEARQAVRRVENHLARVLGLHDGAVAAGVLGMAAGVAQRALEDGATERTRSDFDAVANFAARISDDSSVQEAGAAT